MPSGGKRQGAGRPTTNGTIRKIVSWRLPIHVLTQIYSRAEYEDISVTAWVERALEKALKSNLNDHMESK